MTTDEAREALLAGLVDDESGMETFDDGLIDALIAAVRAEERRLTRDAIHEQQRVRAESEAKLRALREAAVALCQLWFTDNAPDGSQHIRKAMLALRAALAATPAEKDRTPYDDMGDPHEH